MSNQPSGQRRIDRVLNPAYLADLQLIDERTLLARREDAIQEESDVSYVRRMLQGRLDLLRFEKQRRIGNGLSRERGAVLNDDELVKALSSVLTDKTRAVPRGAVQRRKRPPNEPRRLDVAEPSVPSLVTNRREAEAAVADVRFSNLVELTDEVLDRAIENLSEIEARVSTTRHEVQRVADELIAEVERRVGAGEMSTGAL